MSEPESQVDVRASRYVLGEMGEEERRAFEAAMAEDPALAAEVDELREMAGLLERELTRGRGELPEEARAALERAAGGSAQRRAKVTPLAPPQKAPRPRSLGARTTLGLVAAGLALAASIPLALQTERKEGRRHDEQADEKPAARASAKRAEEPLAYATARAADAPKAPSPGPGSGRLGGGHRLREPTVTGNRHAHFEENPFLRPAEQPLATFSIDVDTASWSMARSYLSRGETPPPGSVRIEEMVNYFGYAYEPPTDGTPLRVSVDLGVAPWAPSHRLVRVALRGKDVQLSAQDGVNLVFLVDTSGSMNADNKLPLLKKGLGMMLDKLGPNDKVAIVAYAGSAGLVLPSTSDKEAIRKALDRLSAGGSTNGGAGIDLAYKVAAQQFLRGGVNRVVLATDGDFNVGTTSNDQLVKLVQEKAKTGVFLSVLGFGMGNLNDALLEQIADKGNGMYAYVDNESEARRALVDGLGSLVTIAKDVKLQVEWNPSEVAAYRLLGYENRVLAAQDFNDDKKDAGDLGAGHTVTALFEVIPPGQPVPTASVDPLKYQPVAPAPAPAGKPGELLTVKLRYKEPHGAESKLLSAVLQNRDVSLHTMSADFKFAAAVAGFGMLLRGSPNKGSATWASIAALAEESLGTDPKRRELLELVRKAETARPHAAP